MKYPAYQQYKDSGVAWLDEVPEDWEVKGLRYVCRLAYGDSLAAENREEGEIAVYGSNGQVGSHIISNTKAPVIVVGRKGSFGKINFSGQPVFAIDTTYYIDDNCTTNNLNWLKYALLVLRLDENSKDSAVPGLAREDAYSSKLPVPPDKEQTAIADFLDRETGRIDTLVAKKRKLVELLKEKRSALISRTVTRGLPADAAREFGLTTGNTTVHEAPANYGRGDFNRPQTEANKFAPTNESASFQAFKDSGVEWLGKIPAHWEVKRLKFVFPKLYSGVSVNSENIPATGEFLGILKTSCVYGNKFFPGENKQILEEEYHRVSCPVTADSLIVSRMNTPELVGSCGYVDSNYPNLFLPDRLWIARFSEHRKMLGKFAWYLVSSDLFVKLTAALATGTSGSMKNLSQEAFLNIEISIPDYKEQTAIAAYLDRETAKIDRLVAKVETAITRLQEYRSTLITAAVTGKIDVREAL